jgi:hypothetical protein
MIRSKNESKPHITRHPNKITTIYNIFHRTMKTDKMLIETNSGKT